jgi:tripartite-type tricarboxylate transporter receptor subunit TctC
MKQPLIRQRFALLVLAIFCAAVQHVGAQSDAGLAYPSKPIRLVVPFTPGGSTDILARAIGKELATSLGQPVIVENIAGAGGAIGAERAAKSLPDGYTLLMAHIGTLAVNPSLYPSLPYDPIKSFSPIGLVAIVPNVLVVHPSVNAKTVKELVAIAKAQPGRLNYGSGGNGSAANLATEYFKLQTGTAIVHIPYRGSIPAVTDLIGGQIQLLFTGAPALLAAIKSGQVRALAVSSSSRMELLPNLPTIAETGFKDFEADQWYGIVAPKGTPEAIINQLNSQINKALTSTEFKTRLTAEGAFAKPTTPNEFGRHIAREIARWKPVITSGRVKAD